MPLSARYLGWREGGREGERDGQERGKERGREGERERERKFFIEDSTIEPKGARG